MLSSPSTTPHSQTNTPPSAVTAVDTTPPTMGAKACEKLLTTPGRNTVARYSPKGASVPCHSDTAAARTGSQMLNAAVLICSHAARHAAMAGA